MMSDDSLKIVAGRKRPIMVVYCQNPYYTKPGISPEFLAGMRIGTAFERINTELDRVNYRKQDMKPVRIFGHRDLEPRMVELAEHFNLELSLEELPEGANPTQLRFLFSAEKATLAIVQNKD